MTSLVKICGTTSVRDAQLSVQAGADFLGLIVEHAPSPRSVSLSRAVEIACAVDIPIVAVTVNQSLEALRRLNDELQPEIFQLHGDESPELLGALKRENLPVWVAVHTRENATQMHEAGADALLFDARAHNAGQTVYGGTGLRADWELAREFVQAGARVVLAGGLNADNVSEAVRLVKPWAVDVVSGVEARKGEKDNDKLQAFVRAAKN